jgi:hypothetical protein
MVVDVSTPHTNSPLLPITPFTVPKRTRDKRNTVRREIPASIDELCCVSGAEFRLDTLLSFLNPEDDLQRRWAVQRAVSRMFRGDNGWSPELIRVRPGVYRRI